MQAEERIINAALIGLGHVNRSLLRILVDKKARVEAALGRPLRIRLVADSKGVATCDGGYDPADLLALKAAGRGTPDLAGYRAEVRWDDVLTPDRIDLVFEASPVDLTTGGAGVTVTRLALGRGIPVVLANKAPLVLAFGELADLSRKTGAGLKYSATVCGGLPVMNIASRDMVAGDILRLRGIFNATTNFILDEMGAGVAYGDAMAEAQRRGIAEADPSLDVGGWDTANKLLILANTLLGAGITLADIDVTGINAVTPERMAEAAREGSVIKLIATAENGRFSVAPLAISKDEFLGKCNGWEMAVELHTDIYGINYYKLWEREPVPTAASMLRDAIHLFESKS